jgi:hypothetical protein
MGGKRRFGRPGSGSLLGMMLVNAVISVFVLKLCCGLFGFRWFLPEHLSGLASAQAIQKWQVIHDLCKILHFALPASAQAVQKWGVILPLLPGAAIGFGCLWYWLILVGRSRGLSWTGACVYGILIAFANVPLAGFLVGLLHGNALIGLLLGLVLLFVMPSIWLTMGAFGITMGLFNAAMAGRWIERHRPR